MRVMRGREEKEERYRRARKLEIIIKTRELIFAFR
jgi:hypothetical protein